MSHSLFLALLIVPVLALVVLDFRRAAPASRAAAGFLGVVLLVYFVIQALCARLAPGPFDVVRTSALPTWAAVPIALYASGLVDYLVHRFFSHARPFFFTHEYHHLPSEVWLLMPGLAARPFAVVATVPVTLATGAIAGSVPAMRVVVLLQALLLVTSHSSFLREFRGLHLAMTRLGLTTPREHLLHHSATLRGNYANLTTIWDRAFGTYLDPDVHEPGKLGLPYDQDWLGAITLSRFKLPAWVRARFDVGRWCNLDA